MRKQEVVKVPDGWGARDAGKHFLITEWPAARAEDWAMRMLFAYNRGGGEVPMEAIGGGMQAMFLIGINTFLRGQIQSDEVIPLLNQLLECVKFVRDPKVRSPAGDVIATDIASDDDIMEVKTRLWLRSEVVRVHTNFSPADMLWSLISAITKESPTSPP